MKVIAFTCCAITVFLMLASLGAADWVQAEGWREGLFTQCVKAGAATPLPFEGDPTPGCRKAHSAGYVRGAAALAIICFITDFFGTLLTGLGLRSTDPKKVQVLQGRHLFPCRCSDCIVPRCHYLPYLHGQR